MNGQFVNPGGLRLLSIARGLTSMDRFYETFANVVKFGECRYFKL